MHLIDNVIEINLNLTKFSENRIKNLKQKKNKNVWGGASYEEKDGPF